MKVALMGFYAAISSKTSVFRLRFLPTVYTQAVMGVRLVLRQNRLAWEEQYSDLG